MVKTRRSVQKGRDLKFISSRTRSGQSRRLEARDQLDKKDSGDSSLSESHSPPAKRSCNHAEPVRKESPKTHASKQREGWSMSTRRSRLLSQTGATLQNSHSSLAIKSHPRRVEKDGSGDRPCINGDRAVRRSCRSKSARFESLNQSLLFDQLVNSTAEAVLQEMDNINIRRSSKSREVERLRMWTDTEFINNKNIHDIQENMDMYSRVKRRRKSLRRNSYPIKTRHEESSEGEEEEEEVSEESQEEGEDCDEEVEVEGEEGEENDRPYNLRQRKTVERYQAPPIEPAHQKKRQSTLFDTHRSPARRSHIRRKKHAIHSSDTTSSSDEERFERRKSKSMAKSRNRCLPMNLTAEDLASGIVRERVKVGASLADVDPMSLDRSIRFDRVGGLSQHIYALKEMVVFPLLYPEIFEKFKIQPPRGCLFYGPPGTGKTLVARALANECSQGDRKVSFFMRKGADCLSKWVGESERQLRLLFDQAYVMRPSIIFFDEIDGLAPVRSSRQDQIHSSIVSTLLALMDGLDNRGEIIVIGATNRLDSIDPALRRPGRFDREFLFSLPDQKARKHILQIHTRDWNPKLSKAFLEELAEKCVGYCGADIKALCTEAALIALRRRYPQIYASSQKLQLDISSVVLGAQDFYHAMKNIVPASQRAVMSPGQALSPVIRPLLQRTFSDVLCVLHDVFPHSKFSRDHRKDDDVSLLLDDSEDENPVSIFDVSCVSGSPKKQPAAPHKPFLHFTTSACHQPTSYRPRLLLSGEPGSGQTSHLAPAVLHLLEKFSVHRLDLPALYSVSAKTPEESCAQVFREARRTVPSVVYMPHIGEWWEAVSETVRATFLTLLQDIPSFSPILLLSTSETVYGELPEEVKRIFRSQYEEVFVVNRPDEEDRFNFFQDLILSQAAMPPPKKKNTEIRSLEVLPPAPPPPPRQLSEVEKQKMEDHEENTLRELRLFLRDVTKRLATDKRFNIFSKPVSDYLEVIREPMDLSTIMTKIDKHHYMTVRDFLLDVDLICSNALEYNPDKEPGDKIIRHRACTLKDTAHAIIAAELDHEFNKLCEEIKESRTKRGLSVTSAQVNPQSSVTRKTDAGGEEALQSKHRMALDVGNHSGTKCAFPVRRKQRRRSQWGRGIIKKKKSNYYLKKDEDSKFQDDEENDDPLENGDCLEENGEETGDHSMTNDESSCDVTDGDVEHQNGILGKGSSLESTEEENSNESMLVNSNKALEGKTVTAKNQPLATDYLNGNSSLDSLESTPVSSLQNGKRERHALVTADKDSETQDPPFNELVNCHNSKNHHSNEAPQLILGAAGQHNQREAMEREDEPEEVKMSDDEMVLFMAAATASTYLLNKRHRKRKRQRRFWIHPVIAGREERGQFWVMYNDLRDHEEKFEDYTRMSIKSFDELLQLLSSRLQRMDTYFRNSIPPVERLIITLRYLSTGQSIASLHYAFRIGKSTASYIIRDTCCTIWEVLKEIVFKKPTTEEWAQISEVFWQRCNFPNCLGAIDGKHIRIVKPMASGSQYFNYKKYFSFVLMAVADANYCFTYIDIGSYGSSADSAIFGNSSFGQMLRTDGLDLPESTPLPGTNGPRLPSVFVGDEAFALSTHLLRPYSGHNLNEEKRVFNYRLTRARRVVECAFGILANKWRVLHTPIVLNMQNAISAVEAACALHNFVRRRDGFEYDEPVHENLERAHWTGVRGNTQGTHVRDQYAAYFISPVGQVPWQLDSI